MAEQKLTLLQKLSYAHWSAKFIFEFPYIGWFMVLIVGLIWTGIALYFFEPELKSLMYFPGVHGLGKTYFAVLIGIAIIFAVSYATVYVIFFIQSLLVENDVDRQHFLKYHYRKH